MAAPAARTQGVIMGSLRTLGAKRLSRRTDETTSPERQAAAIERAAPGPIIGWANDIDVSATKTAPFDREELGAWLAQPDEYDAIVWQRLDRAVRSMADMADLGRWAKQHGKRLIFAEGPGGARMELDMSSSLSELIMMILAFAAQMEAQSISERVLSSRSELRRVGRWHGGVPHYGYTPAKNPDGEGWVLVQNPKTAAVVRRVVEELTAGTLPGTVAERLNEDGVPPRGKAVRWTPPAVRRLVSPTLRGYVIHKDAVQYAADGTPRMFTAEPIISDDEWRALRAVLDLRANKGTDTRRRVDSPALVGVVCCGTCKRFMTASQSGRKDGRKLRTYRCPSGRYSGEPCPSPATVTAAPVEAFAAREFLARVGFARVVEVHMVGGVDHRAEIIDMEAQIRDLAPRLAQLRGVAADAVAQQLDAMERRLESFQAQPVVAPERVEVDTGRTFADDWKRHRGRGAAQRVAPADGCAGRGRSRPPGRSGRGVAPVLPARRAGPRDHPR
ncbi:recombinase family protein [Kitasatospora albolonga]|uniref:recombinase family protein n=1 Tax=Kitasatospora albolonga TaxID=68173 RepID=UPI0031E8AE3B